jgi:hypothetical protein
MEKVILYTQKAATRFKLKHQDLDAFVTIWVQIDPLEVDH